MKQIRDQVWWKDKNVLLTGVSGFLGQHLAAAMSDFGAKVYGPSRRGGATSNLTDCFSGFPISLSPCDISVSKDFDEFVDSHNWESFGFKYPDVVIHAAVDVGGIGYNSHGGPRMFERNMKMAMNVIAFCRDYKIPLVFVSTCCIYPDKAVAPFSESDIWNGRPTEENAAYGLAKRCALELLTDMPAPVFYPILANLYGPGDCFDDNRSHAIPAIIKKLLAARDAGQSSVTLWGTGEVTRDFLFVEDAVRGILGIAPSAISQYDVPGERVICNIGSDQMHSIQATANLIAELINYGGDILWDHAHPSGQAERLLSNFVSKSFGYKPKTGFVEGLKATIDWYLANKEGLESHAVR